MRSSPTPKSILASSRVAPPRAMLDVVSLALLPDPPRTVAVQRNPAATRRRQHPERERAGDQYQ